MEEAQAVDNSQILTMILEETLKVNETTKTIRVHVPAITNTWVKRGEERASQSVMLLSGVSASAGDGVNVLVDPTSLQQTQITMDISHSLMFQAEGYLQQFTMMRQGVEAPRFGENSSKLTAMDLAIAKQFKGESAHNMVKAVHYQHSAGVTVEKEPHVAEVGSGVKLMLVGHARNPENVCHVELTAGESGFHSPDAKDLLVKKDKQVRTKKNK